VQAGFRRKTEKLDDSHWFIEDFIDGREFNISVLTGKDGPEVLPPAEIVFVNYDANRPKIIDFKGQNGKWIAFEYINTVREFPGNNINQQLASNLKESCPLDAGICLI